MTVGEDSGYPRIYYQTIRDLGIDPVICGGIPITIGAEGSEEVGSGRSSGTRRRPAQLAEAALAKASGATSGVARKRAPRKATAAGARAAAGTATKDVKMANAKVPAQSVPAKTARGTAKVASSE